MFYVHFRNWEKTKSSNFVIEKSRISEDDEEFGTFREALICVNRHNGIALDDSVLDKYFPVNYEQLKFN